MFTLTAPVLVQLVRALPLTALWMWSQLTSVPQDLLDAAQSEGAGRTTQLVRIALPLRRVGVPAGFVAALVVALAEVSATLLVLLGVLAPLLFLLRYSLNKYDPRLLMIEAFSPENYVKFFTDAYYLEVFWTTLWVAATTTVVCLLLGFPLAYLLARTRTRYKNLLLIGIVIPLFVGNAVRAANKLLACSAWRWWASTPMPPAASKCRWPFRNSCTGSSRAAAIF